MAWFRFLDDTRVQIPFRNGLVQLNIAVLKDEPCWGWAAEKVSDPSQRIVLHRAGNVMALTLELKEEGFEVPDGSPADKIMRAAVKSGFAEELPPDKRWREELLQKRHELERVKAPPQQWNDYRGHRRIDRH